MRSTTAVILLLAAVSCGGEKKNAESKTTAGESKATTDETKAPSDESKAPMEDTVTTVDVRQRGKVTISIPAGWKQGSAEDESIYGNIWRAPEAPDIPSYRLRITLNPDAAKEGETAREHHERRMEWDKKFAGNKFSGDELLDPENTIGRTLTPLASEEIPGGWLWAYEVTYNPETAGLLRPHFGIAIWRYEPGETKFLQYNATGHAQYKDEYFDKLVAIGKSIKIGD